MIPKGSHRTKPSAGQATGASQGEHARARKASGTRLKRPLELVTHAFSNQVDRVGEFVDTLLSLRHVDPLDEQELGLALRELLLNAIEHGNLGLSFEDKSRALEEGIWKRVLATRAAIAPHDSRKVHVTAHWAHDCVVFTIADQGNGFDWRSLPDPTDRKNILLDHGRGVMLARASVDRLRYNTVGNEVTILKRFR
jgi:anti-sigma regulatory factor (Ser/Thr protein kinase)